MEKSFGQRFTELLDARGMNARQLATEIHVAPATLYNARNDKSMPGPQVIAKIAAALDADLEELLRLSGHLTVSLPRELHATPVSTDIRIVAKIQAGPFNLQNMISLEYEDEATVTISPQLAATGSFYALRVEDDTMLTAGALKGGLAIVKAQTTVNDGEAAVVIVHEQGATIKRYKRIGDEVELRPDNTCAHYKTVRYSIDNITVLGKVVEFRNQP